MTSKDLLPTTNSMIHDQLWYIFLCKIFSDEPPYTSLEQGERVGRRWRERKRGTKITLAVIRLRIEPLK